MAPLEGIRPATNDEVSLLSSRRSKVHSKDGPRDKNLDLVEDVLSQLNQTGSVTLEYGAGETIEATRVANRLRSTFRNKGLDIETSILDENGQTKLVIGKR